MIKTLFIPTFINIMMDNLTIDNSLVEERLNFKLVDKEFSLVSLINVSVHGAHSRAEMASFGTFYFACIFQKTFSA